MIRAIALDDQPPALQIVTHFCEKIDFVDLQRSFSRTSEALAFLQANPVDLIILDINMPAISGIDFYKSLPTKIMAIFTTAYSEYAVEGFSLNAIDYLLKPFTYDRFLQAVTKAKEYHAYARLSASNATQPEEGPGGAAAAQHILLRADYGHVKITLTDILFIEGLDNYLRIHLQGRDPVIIRITMKALMEKLPAREFIRVHRSYIVPLGRVGNVRSKTITVAGREIPLGASYEADFYKAFGG